MNNQKQSAKDASAKYTLYDFSKPRKIHKNELKGLSVLTDMFLKQMEICLSGIVRELCFVYNPRIDELSFDAYINTLPKRTMLGFFTLDIEDPDLHDNEVMFNFPSELFFVLMDILLGGPGQSIEIERPHTDIEISICRYLMTKFQDALNDSWATTADADFNFVKIENSTKNFDFKATKENKIVMSFDVSIKNVIGEISVAFSARLIEDLMVHTAKNRNEENSDGHLDTEKDIIRRKTIMNSLSDAELEITAILSELTLNMQDIMSLGVGDIIPLDTKITDAVEIRVENIPWFYGKQGNGNIKKAVKITEVISKKDSE